MKLFNSKLGQMIHLDEPTRPRHRSVIVRLSDIIGLKKSYQTVDSKFKTIFEEALEKMRKRMDKPTRSYHFAADGTLVEKDRPKACR